MRIKKAIVSLLALFNTFEGIIHIIVAIVGLWGAYSPQEPMIGDCS